jgi:hypothetical protein
MQIFSNNHKSSKTRQIIADIFIITLVYFTSYYVKTSSLIIHTNYLALYSLVIFYWTLLSIYHNKYTYSITIARSQYIRAVIWVAGFSLFFISLTMSITGMIDISRLFLLQITFILFVIELLIGLTIPKENISQNASLSSEGEKKIFKDIVRVRYIVPSAIWLAIIFFTMVWIKTSQVYYYQGFERILLVLYGSWALSTAITYRYSQNNKRNIYYYVTPYLKAGILMILFVSILFFFLRLEPLSRILLFGTAIVHSCLEVITFTFIYIMKNVSGPGSRYLSDYGPDILDEQLLAIEKDESIYSKNLSLKDIIGKIIPKEWSVLEDLFSTDILKQEYAKSDISILSTQSVFNINVQEANSSMMIINLGILNNMRRINKYFLIAHEKIKAGGWIVGTYTALEDDWYRLRSKMPKLVFSILYPIYFLVHRVFPKIPYLKNLYFLFTKGSNRKISRAEVLGRLAHSGFKVVNEIRQNSTSYFIAQKVKLPSIERNPSYGPIIQLNRIGYHGEHINIYKFRTMHPYSEFIQKEVFKKNDLNASGKLRNDFRITKWGKFIRKLWIDELPQLLNWFRGDLAIVGVRALSEHYFSLYPENLQNLRTQFKPGLIPPYYADLPKNFEKILDSERNYLLQKQKHPFKTDFTYFWKAMYNILIKGVRSS